MKASPSVLLSIAAGAALSLAFAPGAAASPPSDEFAEMDGNNDGKVSSSEHETYARKSFDSIDTDHDDKVSMAELDAAQGRITDHEGGSPYMNSAQKIRSRDANADGFVSQGEQADAAAARFQELDADHNGELTPQEFDSAGA
jgi:Ca2+-binding EF-hand superfamily protein